MKKIIIIIGTLVVILGALFIIGILRPAPAPSQDIETAGEENQLSPIPGAQTTLYRLSQAESNVEFRIDEILRGSPFTAVGTTNQIAGDIRITNNNGTHTFEFGTLTINARTFKTDATQRDNAIQNFILRTGDPANEFIRFANIVVTGAPQSIRDGESFQLTLTGDLTVSGITKRETFSVTMTREKNILRGTATATIKRSDYNLVIPSVPFVANVSDSFIVGGTFTALSVQ